MGSVKKNKNLGHATIDGQNYVPYRARGGKCKCQCHIYGVGESLRCVHCFSYASVSNQVSDKMKNWDTPFSTKTEFRVRN